MQERADGAFLFFVGTGDLYATSHYPGNSDLVAWEIFANFAEKTEYDQICECQVEPWP